MNNCIDNGGNHTYLLISNFEILFVVEDFAGAWRGRVCPQFQDERLNGGGTSSESWCGSMF